MSPIVVDVGRGLRKGFFMFWELTFRIVALFYGVMVIAGLINQSIFSAFGGVPTRRMLKVSSAHF